MFSFSVENGVGEGVIEEILPRGTCLFRPHVANVDQLILVMALRDPGPDWLLISRLLVLAEQERMEALVCLNKADLVDKDELDCITGMLTPFPYPYLFTSCKNGRGIDELKARLQESCSVFAGPSGAGKSSLLNAVQPGLSLKTGSISIKGKRGRHTTRLVELLYLVNGGMVVDTPGFSRLDFSELAPGELNELFPELAQFTGCCTYRNCNHLSEPGCAVRDAAASGTVNALRYQHYKLFLQEIKDRRR